MRFEPPSGRKCGELETVEAAEITWRTLPEYLRETADEGEARRSLAGREKLVVMLLRDAANEIERLGRA